ncbi:methylmalonyl-CoA mutase family protein [Tsukamurella sp. 8F]|uniref:methylmalonyl-CoA mutase family protein n=1 Tax=unclassified Tsukamurella TaxID=2633480 RepID=UPI0023BA19F1|nr:MULTISPECIES: methylmalonyl-CoA mutase family protein [unclassified Tsukamurella]MDF0529291.1 methylmalonyl-CoA mutase family protein [Tsukamurella sp. 8J]MDF0586872.1 methylmalonyl-CoA mutase family protein [Tsukamurella sp. 8F]
MAVDRESLPERYEDWRESVGAVLAKSRGGDAPDDPVGTLTARTEDGIAVSPLYTALDEVPEAPLPGTFPFRRGTDALRDVRQGWKVTERFAPDEAEGVIGALESGASALWLSGDPSAALRGVLLDLAPVWLGAGDAAADSARALYAALDGAERIDPEGVHVNLGAAPLTSAVVGRSDVDLDEAVGLAKAAAERPEDVRAIVVDGADLHNAGATAAQELGLAAAAGLDYLRALEKAGLTIPEALSQLAFRFGVTDDQFLGIAKFRAWRTVWARVAGRLGHPAEGAAPVHAVLSLAATTQRDPWVNMLRATVAAFGAGVGGADYVTTLPFDSALAAGAPGYSAAFSRRIARNTQLLLLEESNLGRVLDPGAGSWHVEALTDDLARAAWQVLQDIEGAGGLAAACADGTVSRLLSEASAKRDDAVARRKVEITGVNEFPNLAEAPVAGGPAENGAVIRSYAAPFEALRARSDIFLEEHGVRPRVWLVTIGTVAQHNGRSTFVTNLLGSGGIEAVADRAEAATGSARVDGSPGEVVAVLAGSDAGYAEEGEAAAAAARSGGADRVLLAGAAGTLPEGSVDGCLHTKIDAVAELGDLLNRLGA